MTEVPQDCVVTADDLGLGEFFELDSQEQPPLGIDELQDGSHARDLSVNLRKPPDYLARAKQVYGPLGAPRKFMEFAAGIHMRLDALQDPRCDTPEKETMIHDGLASCVDAALTELIVDISLEVNQVAALALEIRGLAPEICDRWVRLQFTIGKPLAMLTAKRNSRNIHEELSIEEGLREGRLVAGAITSTAPQFENFVGIARLTLEADLNIKTLDEQMELDLALNDFVQARRISSAAQSLISPAGPVAKDLAEALKLMNQARSFDKSFRVTIDRMRARNRRGLRTVELAIEKKVSVKATARVEESDRRTAASA